MIYLALLCLMTLVAASFRELIMLRKNGTDFSWKGFLLSPSLWKTAAFIGVGFIVLLSILFWDVMAVLHMTSFRFICGSVVVALLFGMSVLFGLGHKPQKWGIMAVCFLILTMLLEGVFNFRTFQTAEFEPVNLMEYLTSSKGAQVPVNPELSEMVPALDEVLPTEDKAPTEPGKYILKDKKLEMEFTDLGFELDNLWIGVYAPGKEGNGENVKVSLQATDEGNELYYSLKSRDVIPLDKTTKWIALDTAGVSEKLSMTLEIGQTELEIEGIMANVPKPARISLIRMILVFLLAFGLYAIRPGSPLYRRKLTGSGRQVAFTAVIVILNMVLAFTVIACGNRFLNLISKQHDQYQMLASQLAQGEVTYPAEVPQFLLEMENPYDRNLRTQAAAEAGETYMWDVAFYEGEYYVYFGITPVILLYLPFYLITGKMALPNDIVVFIGVALFIAGAFMLMYRFLKRKFPDVPYLLYLLLSLLVANCSGIFNLLIYPSLYTVPIAIGMALTVWGLALWLGALEKPTLSGWQLVLGSLCMALVAGCRPQMLLWSFLAVPLFYNAFVKEKTLLPTSKNGVKKLLCFALPYVVVAAGLMYYNAIRFGSPFDFGANYNLTTNDMTVRGFQMGRIGSALYTYLLQFPKCISNYPFIRFSDFDTTYMGTTIRETTYGGLFVISPFVLLSFAAFGFRKWLKEHKLFGVSVFMLLCGVVVAVMDAQMAGLLQRYFSDFTLFFMLAAVVVFTIMYRNAGQVGRKCLLIFMTVTMCWSLWHSAMLVFASGSLTMPVWLKTAIQFWM